MINENANGNISGQSVQSPAQHIETPEKEESKQGFKIVYDAALVHEFQMVPVTTQDESEWYGPWDSLLHRLFSPRDGFQIAPQHQISNLRGGPEWTVFFLIKHHLHVIACIVEIKPYYHYKSHKLRINAYEQLKDRLEICLEDQIAEHTSAIYGLSCIGPRFMVMKLNTRTERLQPRLSEETTAKGIAKVAPKHWWSHQVLKKKGCMHLHRLVEEVKKSLNRNLELVTNEPISFNSLPDDDSDTEISWDKE